MAELVDALGSGSSGGTPVRVQIPASAPIKAKLGRLKGRDKRGVNLLVESRLAKESIENF